MYNLPIDEMMRSLNYSLQQGYTVEWDADVSNNGFAPKYAMAIVPEKDWADKNEAQRAGTFKYYEPQKLVSQEYRQKLFDQQITMDDHLMHITGIETENHNSDIFYTVKNSWGEISDLKGYLRVSEPYMRLNTISFLVNRNALPQDIQQRMGFAPGDANQIKNPGQDKSAPPRSTAPAKIKKMEPTAKKAAPGSDH